MASGKGVDIFRLQKNPKHPDKKDRKQLPAWANHNLKMISQGFISVFVSKGFLWKKPSAACLRVKGDVTLCNGLEKDGGDVSWVGAKEKEMNGRFNVSRLIASLETPPPFPPKQPHHHHHNHYRPMIFCGRQQCITSQMNFKMNFTSVIFIWRLLSDTFWLWCQR